MQIFGVSEASFYCQAFTQELGDAELSISTFKRAHIPRSTIIKEGTPLFQEYRACSLRNVERSLFFAVSHYRRCLDCLLSSSSPWAQVTMYYGSFFAAKSLLGMFGCTIFDHHVVDVRRSFPSKQELQVRRIGNRVGEVRTTYTGSHRKFWDLFYRTVIPLRPLVGPSLSYALVPIANNPVWQIEQRNAVNYDMYSALQSAHHFKQAFSSSTFPSSLPGPIGTQYGLLEALIQIAFIFANQFSLITDGLSPLATSGTRGKIINTLVYSEKAPRVLSKTKKRRLTK